VREVRVGPVSQVKRDKVVRKRDDEPVAPEKKESLSGKGEKIKKEIDDLLDEIDEVLEENAEDFVKSYVQRGGE